MPSWLSPAEPRSATLQVCPDGPLPTEDHPGAVSDMLCSRALMMAQTPTPWSWLRQRDLVPPHSKAER